MREEHKGRKRENKDAKQEGKKLTLYKYYNIRFLREIEEKTLCSKICR